MSAFENARAVTGIDTLLSEAKAAEDWKRFPARKTAELIYRLRIALASAVEPIAADADKEQALGYVVKHLDFGPSPHAVMIIPEALSRALDAAYDAGHAKGHRS